MMKKIEEKLRKRLQRKRHIRKQIFGTAERPRMTVYRSNRYVYIQVIDDASGVTIAAVNNRQKDSADLKTNVENAAKLGEKIGARLKEQSVDTVVFDRNGYKYHGIVKAIADGARKTGLKF
ncbi:50S ribosomal protein L18 [Marispirochaeta aestuarii]|uniref:50S ribosomal protein L18 n=1 Tax=Marispirochaeta aestuarii TaxID=1963862 RepID=UPI0029C7A7F9|nr:50S ribosomal protein L18 [Marispirochaeta aestuarii]